MKRNLLILSLSSLLTVNFINAQSTMQPEDLWKLARINEPQLSPDKKTVVFGLRNFDIPTNSGNTDIYIVEEGKKPTPILQTKGSEFNLRWRPDGKKIGYLSAESGDVQLWEINPDGSGKEQITRITGGIDNFNYSPDGKSMYFTQEVQTEKMTAEQLYPDMPKSSAKIYDGLMYRHWTEFEDGMRNHVFVADYPTANNMRDLMQGEPYDAPLKPHGGEEQLNWSPDGKKIAYTAKKLTGTEAAFSTNSDIYVYDLITQKTENISVSNKGYDVEPRFSPDGKYIAWSSMQKEGYEADKNRIFLYDIKKRTITDLSSDFDQNAEGLLWTSDSEWIYFTSSMQATHQVYGINIHTKKIKKITEGVHDLAAFAVRSEKKSDVIFATRVSMLEPMELVTIQAKNSEIKPLTTVNESIMAGFKKPSLQKRMVKTTDGKQMLVWVMYPPDFDAKKTYPTLLYCQGGPQSVVSQFFSYRWNFFLMASQGYIVVAPNRRGLPSFGQEWNDAIQGDWGGQAMRDYLSAIDDVSKEKYVDKKRVGAVGASYGGYSVYWLAGNHQKRFKTFIAHCGLFNLESFYGTTEEMFFAQNDLEGAYWENPMPRSYAEFSPHHFVKNWDTPILVIHNEKDYRVPFGEGMQAFNAAQIKKLKSRFLVFSDEGHWVTKPQNSIVWQREFYRWLKETL